jgi:hypothetical protein
VCVMTQTHELFGSVDSYGMLGGGGRGGRKSKGRSLNVRGRSAKHMPKTNQSTHPRLQNMGAPIVICTTQRIKSGNTSIVKRNCTVDSPVIDDPMNNQLVQMVIDEPNPSGKHSKTRKAHGTARGTNAGRRTARRAKKRP